MCFVKCLYYYIQNSKRIRSEKIINAIESDIIELNIIRRVALFRKRYCKSSFTKYLGHGSSIDRLNIFWAFWIIKVWLSETIDSQSILFAINSNLCLWNIVQNLKHKWNVIWRNDGTSWVVIAIWSMENIQHFIKGLSRHPSNNFIIVLGNGAANYMSTGMEK